MCTGIAVGEKKVLIPDILNMSDVVFSRRIDCGYQELLAPFRNDPLHSAVK
jgi:hypothetical protein